MEFEAGVVPQNEPRQGRLNLEKDYFVYVAVMNCETTKYLENISNKLRGFIHRNEKICIIFGVFQFR